tara:strand:- start:932 stop:1291 length:360 start_codon:yes stop_codon:yes gene_type:complete
MEEFSSRELWLDANTETDDTLEEDVVATIEKMKHRDITLIQLQTAVSGDRIMSEKMAKRFRRANSHIDPREMDWYLEAMRNRALQQLDAQKEQIIEAIQQLADYRTANFDSWKDKKDKE